MYLHHTPPPLPPPQQQKLMKNKDRNFKKKSKERYMGEFDWRKGIMEIASLSQK